MRQLRHLAMGTLATAMVVMVLVGCSSNAAIPNYESRCQDKGWADDIPGKECVALLALHDSTGGDDWKDRTGWLSSSSPCEWHGISCKRGHVVSISLLSNQLTGPVPPELGSLGDLRILELSYNQLTGTIPPELGNLGALEVLLLHDNQLTGTIPPPLKRLCNTVPKCKSCQTIA